MATEGAEVHVCVNNNIVLGVFLKLFDTLHVYS